ncbi:cell division protein FtsA [Candidatus Dependentiae bacterium]|nr:cell division protein FtsA [Candidatus Dependentiae bacterium]
MKGNIFSELIVAIDIGTTKICVLVAQQQADGTLEIVGIGNSPSHGLKKGVVVDIAKTVQSIKLAVSEAQLMAGCTIDRACIGISGSHIKSLSSQGVVPIKRGQISHQDIANVLAAAQAIALPEGQQILHVLPHYFVIDGNERINDPFGMYGVRLEANVHIITGGTASAQNLINCCESAGIKVTDIVLEQLASAAAVLSPDERELGVGMLDIGGGTSDLALYAHGAIRYTHVIPVAGNQFTNDLAVGLQTTLIEAERIKKEFGSVQEIDNNEIINVASLQDGQTHDVWLPELSGILRPRATELLMMVKQIIDSKQLNQTITAGFVLTGGGSLLNGLVPLAHEILKVPVRIGRPRLDHTNFITLTTPLYATGYGLLLHALQKSNTSTDGISGPLVSRMVARMKSWVSDFF